MEELALVELSGVILTRIAIFARIAIRARTAILSRIAVHTGFVAFLINQIQQDVCAISACALVRVALCVAPCWCGNKCLPSMLHVLIERNAS
jgi:hypothetical protein